MKIRTDADKESFDVVLGNAPWGDRSILPEKLLGESNAEYQQRIKSSPPTAGQKWAEANKWPVANKDIGPLFLAKAAVLVKPSGFVAMVDTASLLYWRDGPAMELRKKLFSTFTFEEVTNLSALRRELSRRPLARRASSFLGSRSQNVTRPSITTLQSPSAR